LFQKFHTLYLGFILRKLKELNLLYVEDSRFLRNIISSSIENYVNQVYLAEDGKDAYVKYKNLQKENISIDIVITDIEMPNMNGVQLIKHLKRFNPKLICIVFSSFTSKSDIEYLAKLDILSFIEKPFDLSKFLEKLRVATLVLNENSEIYNILDNHEHSRRVELTKDDIQELSSIYEEIENFSNSLLFCEDIEDNFYKTKLADFQELIKDCNNIFYLYINEKAKEIINSFSMAVHELFVLLYNIDFSKLKISNQEELFDIIISVSDDIINYMLKILNEKYFVSADNFIDSFLSDVQYLKLFLLGNDEDSEDLDFF
jgi:YesN/AraC family two-component response regulator